MIKYSIIGLLSLLMPLFGVAQSDCFEVKYLDFFELVDPEKKSSINELKEFSQMEPSELHIKKDVFTNFIIPMLVAELRNYHPTCGTEQDKEHYQALLEAYFHIRKQDIKIIEGKDVAKQLAYIREDYYAQIMCDTILPYMTMTLADGPHYGQTVTEKIDYKDGITTETIFGKIMVVEKEDKAYLLGFDKENQLLWTKNILIYNAFVKQIKIESIKQNSICLNVHVSCGGHPPISLYLRPTGQFMFYYLPDF